MKTNQENVIEIDLLELFFALLHRIKLIIFVTVAGAVGAFFVTEMLITPIYSSSSMIYVVGDSLDVSSLVNMQVGSALTADYQVIATSRPVVEQVIKNLDLDMTYKELKEAIVVTNTTDTHIIELKVSDPSAKRAKEIVDELTGVVIEESADIMDSGEPNIIQNGYVNKYPDSPSIVKNTILGGLLGFVLACGIVIFMFMLNDTITTEEDIEKYLGLNTLGVIPSEGKKNKLSNSNKKKTKKKK